MEKDNKKREREETKRIKKEEKQAANAKKKEDAKLEKLRLAAEALPTIKRGK